MLLLATMIRLALNVVSTRLILTHGHEGRRRRAGDRGVRQVRHGGQPLIGPIVFVILLIVNFLVITKGAARIAEVSARFTLDAMPGKQMAIDADLAAGRSTSRGAGRAPPAGGGEQLLRRDGRCHQVREGRRHRRPSDHLINFVGGLTIGVGRWA